jgi:hypothetical protein
VITVLAFVFGVYGGADVGIEGASLPNLLGGCLGLLLLAIHVRRLPSSFLYGIAALCTLYLLSGINAVAQFELPLVSLAPTGMLLYSLLGVAGIILDLSLWKRRDIQKLGLYGAVIILAGCLIEISTPLKDATRDFANFLIGLSGHIAEWDSTGDRDLILFGAARPTLFTSETSLVAIGYTVFVSIWFLAKRSMDQMSIGLLVIMTLVALAWTRSPFPLFALAIFCLSRVVPRRDSAEKLRYSTWALALLFAVPSIYIFFTTFNSIFASRISTISSGGDWSTTMRTYGAILVGWEAALERPFFGYGPGNIDLFESTMKDVYARFGVPWVVLDADYFRTTLNNGLGASLAYFGLVGFATYILLLTYILQTISPMSRWPFLFGLIILICFFSGSIYTYRYINPLLLLAFVGGSVFRHDDRSEILNSNTRRSAHAFENKLPVRSGQSRAPGNSQSGSS